MEKVVMFKQTAGKEIPQTFNANVAEEPKDQEICLIVSELPFSE